MSAVRPLPARQSLAYDRKEAKALLKQLHAGVPTALQRAGQHVARSNARTTDVWKLADAQRIIAREYGLPSWPRLVDYFADLERHRNAPRHKQVSEPVEHLERVAQHVLQGHARRDQFVAREMAQYVPSCFGRGVAFKNMPVRHDADDLEIMWEAFRIAGWYRRWHSMDALLETGLPIDHAPAWHAGADGSGCKLYGAAGRVSGQPWRSSRTGLGAAARLTDQSCRALVGREPRPSRTSLPQRMRIPSLILRT